LYKCISNWYSCDSINVWFVLRLIPSNKKGKDILKLFLSISFIEVLFWWVIGKLNNIWFDNVNRGIAINL